jgi:hypothetical protein
VLIFDLLAEAVADGVDEELGCEPFYDARLTGATAARCGPTPTWAPASATAEPPEQVAIATKPSLRGRTPKRRRFIMLVRDGMNPIVVTLGPEHMLREAARRMTARGAPS